MQTEPEQWAVELWHAAYDSFENCATQSFGDDDKAAALTIQRAFEERERKLREEVLRTGTALVNRSANFMQGCVRVSGTPEFREFRATLEALKETPDAG